MCQCALMYGYVWHRTLTTDIADAKLYILIAAVNRHNCVAVRCGTATDGNATPHALLRPSTYDDTVCVNAAAEINLLDYVAVWQSTAPHIVRTVLKPCVSCVACIRLETEI